MRNDQSQLVEATRTANGYAAVISDTGGLAWARSDGADAGELFRATTVGKAIAVTLKRATELQAVIDTATRTEQECQRRSSNVERARKLAVVSLFGGALDIRLRELDSEKGDIWNAMIQAQRDCEAATVELQKLRDEVMVEPLSVAKRATTGRVRTVEAERAQAADKLAAAVAQHIAAVLKLDGEVAALREADPRREIEQALAEQLPAVFGAGGIAPVVERDEEERDDVTVRPYQGWRRPGHEEVYGEGADAWDSTSHDPAPRQIPDVD